MKRYLFNDKPVGSAASQSQPSFAQKGQDKQAIVLRSTFEDMEMQPYQAAVPSLSNASTFHKFLCPICFKLIYRCVTTICGHSYCEACIDEYLLVKKVSQDLFEEVVVDDDVSVDVFCV